MRKSEQSISSTTNTLIPLLPHSISPTTSQNGPAMTATIAWYPHAPSDDNSYPNISRATDATARFRTRRMRRWSAGYMKMWIVSVVFLAYTGILFTNHWISFGLMLISTGASGHLSKHKYRKSTSTTPPTLRTVSANTMPGAANKTAVEPKRARKCPFASDDGRRKHNRPDFPSLKSLNSTISLFLLSTFAKLHQYTCIHT